MTTILWGLTIYLLILALFQIGMVTLFCRWLSTAKFVPRTAADIEFCPTVAIVLSVRGQDPSLAKSLQGLSEQEYAGAYRIFVIIDHAEDAAVPVVTKFIADVETGFESILGTTPSGRCSLKCDRLIQVISQLPVEYEVVCLIDADTIPDRRWLSSLISPLQDPKIAAACGNRWFYPDRIGNGNQATTWIGGWGSMIRYLWNSAAIVQMYVYGVVWGGSLAIRRTELKETGLLDVWSKSLFDDVLIKDHFQANGWQVVSVPELLIANVEHVSLRGAIEWIKRQLLDARLYHRNWPLILSHAIGSSLLWIMLFALLFIGFIASDGLAMFWSGALLGSLVVMNYGLLIALEVSANANINRRRDWLNLPPINWLTGRRCAEIFFGVFLVQVGFGYAAIWAAFSRRMRWRGCEYHIRGKFDIEIIDYQPFRPKNGAESGSIE